jgi:hypothetical protein
MPVLHPCSPPACLGERTHLTQSSQSDPRRADAARSSGRIWNRFTHNTTPVTVPTTLQAGRPLHPCATRVSRSGPPRHRRSCYSHTLRETRPTCGTPSECAGQLPWRGTPSTSMVGFTRSCPADPGMWLAMTSMVATPSLIPTPPIVASDVLHVSWATARLPRQTRAFRRPLEAPAAPLEPVPHSCPQ